MEAGSFSDLPAEEMNLLLEYRFHKAFPGFSREQFEDAPRDWTLWMLAIEDLVIEHENRKTPAAPGGVVSTGSRPAPYPGV